MAFSNMDSNYDTNTKDEEIKEIKSSKFGHLKELKEPLNEKNWGNLVQAHDWHAQGMQMLPVYHQNTHETQSGRISEEHPKLAGE